VHENSVLLFDRYAKAYFTSGAQVLEVGPDGFPSTYQRAVGDPSISWDTLDITDVAQLTYANVDQYCFPVADDSYDLVVAAQVIEHVKKIWVWVRELERVCRSGGHVVIVNPVSWPYHPAPVDCWRIYPEGMRALLEDTRLEVVECVQGSLEAPRFKRHVPGRSYEHQQPRLRWFARLAGRCGLPVECAYDTLTVARKA
jgi:SAM-dependent methyltransferase